MRFLQRKFYCIVIITRTLFTMGNKPTHFKNFTLPDISLNLQYLKPIQIHCSHLQKKVNLDPKYIFKTLSLKTQNYVQIAPEPTVKQVKSLKILTYNVWFDNSNIDNRLQALFKIIADSNADIICLQQVTEKFTQALWNNSKAICTKGQLFMPVIPMHWYDTMILTRFPIQFYQIPFVNSFMERKLLMGVFEVVDGNNQKTSFSINCVHLESMNHPQIRMNQLKQITEANKNIDTVCLVGDMNFTDGWPEDKMAQAEYLDLWREFQPKGTIMWTMPKTPDFGEWRPDHVFLKSNKSGNKVLQKRLTGRIERVGTFTIPPFEDQRIEDILKDKMVRSPSDHMGLLVNFTF